MLSVFLGANDPGPYVRGTCLANSLSVSRGQGAGEKGTNHAASLGQLAPAVACLAPQ